MVKNKIAGKGHNKVGRIAVDQLLSVIERIEKLLEEKAETMADISDVKSEAKGNGFDIKAIMVCIKERAMDAEKREEQENIQDIYRRAVGLIPIDDVV